MSEPINHTEIQSQLEALQKKIRKLEARSGMVPGRLARIWLPLMLAVLLVFGVLGAQNKPDALFIDQNGNVGINQSRPEAPLDVNGNTIVRGAVQINGNASVQGQVTGKLDVNGDTTVSGLLSARKDILQNPKLPANSGVVVGNSDIYFTNAVHNHTGQGNQTNFAAIENAQNFNALMILGRSTPNGRMIGMWDRVGIGTGDPQASLDVRGDVAIQGSLNGEKPRMIFRIPATRSSRWGVAARDIGPLCADEDGCRIKLVMQDVTNDDTRTIDEWIVIKQPNISNAQPGRRGYTRQSAGGEYGFRLDTQELATLFSPWNWCYAQNFQHEWAYGRRSGPYAGNTIYFMCHPNINALVIIYDR